MNPTDLTPAIAAVPYIARITKPLWGPPCQKVVNTNRWICRYFPWLNPSLCVRPC